MEDSLLEASHQRANSLVDARLIVFNTCCIREKASEKLFSDLGRVRALMNGSAEKFLIAVTGCVAQFQAQDVLKRAPWVDIILGTQDIHQIATKVDEAMHKQLSGSLVSTTLNAKSKFMRLSEQFFHRNVAEFITIQEGCNNFCTYCVVPHSRGREFSRAAVDVIQEAKQLILLGVKEITLLGQNVNAYAGEGLDGKKWNLSRLLAEFGQLNGLKRLRYITSHPRYMDEGIAEAHEKIATLAPSLHLPIQSGSNRVLGRMNRKYTVEEYLKCIQMLREHRPDLAFSSDFIVGFPGETDEDFQQTIELVEKVRFSQAYSFKYSSRPNTAAATMNDQISDTIKSQRLRVLQDLLNEQQNKFNKSFVGRHVNVLFTKKGKHKDQITGRSEYAQAVTVYNDDGAVFIGDIARVEVTETLPHSLIGKVVK
jgi:tRNA-2-methylthio-N6-dimethylallyladenosine synthase